ncbi:MAG: 8-oxo-dGTP diphosphatase [Candidatus Aenigmarchaeota archaeon]|nr:8-oxo-dGTP diphosphatase [Candidatus Aenigmarchaeota archaeon]
MKVATLCYVQSEGKTLMVNVKKEGGMHKGKWNGLGGKIDEGETPEECAVREVFEESGLKITKPKLVGVISFPFNVSKAGESWIVFVFSAEKFEGQLIENSKEGELEWIDNGKLLELNLNGGDKWFLPFVLENKLFTAKIVYREDVFVPEESWIRAL